MVELSKKDNELLDRIAEKVVKYQLTTPAVYMLESVKPLNVVGAQALVFLTPVLSAFFNREEIGRISELLERRETLEEIIVRIEKKDEEYFAKKREERQTKKDGK